MVAIEFLLWTELVLVFQEVIIFIHLVVHLIVESKLERRVCIRMLRMKN